MGTDTFKIVECHSRGEAEEILKAAGIDVTLCYQHQWKGKYNRYSYGIHIYFNTSDTRNIGWYTPIMQVLGYYGDKKGRVDETPIERRGVIELIHP